MKIFITGASGFIGTELLKQLKDTKHELICLVRKTSPSFKKIKSTGVTVVEGDIRDKASVLQGMKGCDWAVHLAALYSFWQKNNKLYREINVNGTRNVMECALELEVSKVIYVSTIAVFGKPTDYPYTEKSNPGPKLYSRYAKTKSEAGKMAYEMYRNNGLPLVTIYPGVVLGPDNEKTSGKYVSDVVNKKMPMQVLKNVAFTWVHIKDVALGIIKALEKADNIGEKYLIGNETLSFGDFNKMISEVSGVKLPKLSMPTWLAIMNARILTGISRITNKEPMLGLSTEQVVTMSHGSVFDGSKAEKELGIKYTPVRKALEEEMRQFN